MSLCNRSMIPGRTEIQEAQHTGIYGYCSRQKVTYGASAVVLSDKKQFPSFFRLFPSDKIVSQGIAKFVKHIGWTWVGIIAEETDFGLLGSQIVNDNLLNLGVCVSFYETIPTVNSGAQVLHAVQVLKTSTAKGIILFFSQYNMYLIIEEIKRQNISEKVWIVSESWSAFTPFENNAFMVLNGSIIFGIHNGEIRGFREFLYQLSPATSADDIYVNIFWEHVFGCKWTSNVGGNTTYSEVNAGVKICSGAEELYGIDIPFFDMSTLRITYNAYICVYVIANALHNLYSYRARESSYSNSSCIHISCFEPWQLLLYVKKVHFRTKSGDDVFFDENGDPPAVYDILNWLVAEDGTSKYFKIGRFDPGAQMPLSVCSELCAPGYRKVIQEGQALCCFRCVPCSEVEIANISDSIDCLRCPDEYWPNKERSTCVKKIAEFLSFSEPLGATLAIISIINALIPIFILLIFVKHRDTPIVKANNRGLTYLLLLSMILCSLCPLMFIGRPQVLSCMVRQPAFSIIFTLSVSCVLSKTVMVVLAFNATKPNSRLKKWASPTFSYMLVLLCVLFQVTICCTWLATSPPYPEQNMKSQTGKILLECNEGSPLAFWSMLGYMGFLASLSFALAFLSRNLPDSFNEGKLITFSMLVFVTVWLAFVPAYISTRGKYMVAVEIFTILSSSVGLLFCIFVPKCYIIVIRPEMNTKDYLMGKGTIALKKK
ncbi:extracellular calcium-sensing receptor-like [Protopterus annectens]|uniref:extracellular calcium-sensing receptor-like n=1 Tax=Protopterus annectens TaxID=7888 RepID=UPI001CF9C6E0|nr:extracellular calcium-sensing receptor-like [Protopterus annectens]